MSLEQVEGDVAQHGQVLGGMPLTDSACILVEGHTYGAVVSPGMAAAVEYGGVALSRPSVLLSDQGENMAQQSDWRHDAARATAEILLRVGAVSINSRQLFTYASGIQSPIYTDNRLLISYPEERKVIAEGLARSVGDGSDVDVVAGTATAGIPWAAWVADRLGKPLVYVRSSAKEHGRGRQVEGRLSEGQRVVVVEDLISTGMSSLQTVDALRSSGATVGRSVAIFSYEFSEAIEGYRDRGVALATLTTITRLLEVAAARGYIDYQDQQAVERWLEPHRR